MCDANDIKVIKGGGVITKNVLKRVDVCGVARGEGSPFQVVDVTLLSRIDNVGGKSACDFFSFLFWCAYGCVPKPSYTSRYVVSACLAIVFQQQIALLMDAAERLKDLHRSSSPRETVVFELSGPCGEYLQLLNSWHGSESEEMLLGSSELV